MKPILDEWYEWRLNDQEKKYNTNTPCFEPKV